MNNNLVLHIAAWSNGLAERVMRDIHALLLIFTNERRHDRTNWPQLRNLIMYTINQRPSCVLNGFSPVKVHTGLDPTDPLEFIFGDKTFQDLQLTQSITEHVETLNETMDMLHQLAFDATAKVNRGARRNEQSLPMFEIGDYVLYSFVDRPRKQGKYSSPG